MWLFEIGKVGLLIVIVGVVYLLLVGWWFLLKCGDMFLRLGD